MIDSIVHRQVILEFDLPSYRTNAAQNRQAENEADLGDITPVSDN